MDGIKENTLLPKIPNDDFMVRALDDQGRSCVIAYSTFQVGAPQEGDIKDFLEDGTIKKKRYLAGEWIETGIEWEI